MSILQLLQLEHIADTMIGSQFVCGLLGGKLQRVSLGIKLVVRPSVTFLNKVTSEHVHTCGHSSCCA